MCPHPPQEKLGRLPAHQISTMARGGGCNAAPPISVPSAPHHPSNKVTLLSDEQLEKLDLRFPANPSTNLRLLVASALRFVLTTAHLFNVDLIDAVVGLPRRCWGLSSAF